MASWLVGDRADWPSTSLIIGRLVLREQRLSERHCVQRQDSLIAIGPAALETKRMADVL